MRYTPSGGRTMARLASAIVAMSALLATSAFAQDTPNSQLGSSFGQIGEALPPPVLPNEEAFVEAVNVNHRIDMVEGFRIFDDGRYEIYGDKVWIRMPDGSVRWTPVPLGWHPLKTLDVTQVTSIAYAARESGIMGVDAVIGEEEPKKVTPASAEPVEDLATWTWTVRLDGDVHTVKVVGYPKTRSPRGRAPVPPGAEHRVRTALIVWYLLQ